MVCSSINMISQLQVQSGPRFLDAFRFTSVDVIDSLLPNPEAKSISSAKPFDPSALSPFCMPNGAEARLIPRNALRGAAEFGWIGSLADQYNVLVVSELLSY